MRTTAFGAALAKAWHRWAPSFKVKKRVFGLTMYFDFKDNAIWWASDAAKLEQDEKAWDLLKTFKGTVWDVGSNVGLFSLRAASLGHKVIAFDISGKALNLLQSSARANNLNITTVKRAFSTRSFKYDEPGSADTENAIRESPTGRAQSITFVEAAREFPMPDFLKMDIEGGEVEFMRSAEFKKWILDNQIPWVLEFHSPDFKELIWKDCNFTLLDPTHYGLNLDKIGRRPVPQHHS